MHAISRDPAAFPQPCIYTQIETDGMLEDEDEDEAVEGPASTDLSKVQEMRLVPQDPAVSEVDHVFQVLCDCALLNPDPEEEQEGEAEWFFNADEVLPNVIGSGNGHHDIANLVIDDSRYEDAEEEESIEDEES